MSIYHVAPRGDSWTAEAEGTTQSSGVYSTREEAIDAAKKSGATVVVYKADGTIDRSYAPDDLTLTEPEESFEDDLGYLLEKNAELYRRLAR